MKYIKLPSTETFSVSNSYFLWLYDLTCVIYCHLCLVNEYSLALNGRLANITGFCQYHSQYNNKNTSIEAYSIIDVKIAHCFCDFFSPLNYLSAFWSLQALSFQSQSEFNQIVAFTNQKLFANERISLVSTALKFSVLRARKIILI